MGCAGSRDSTKPASNIGTPEARQPQLASEHDPRQPEGSSYSSSAATAAQISIELELRRGEMQVAGANITRYTEPSSIWAALESGHVRLVRMSWLIKYSKVGNILARRQELPAEAFISVDKLKALYGKGNRDGVLPIIAISFCWLTPQHPDPEGKQLAIIAAQLEREKVRYATGRRLLAAGYPFEGFSEMGVFWDWASLFQKDPALFDEKETPDAKRESEREAFLEDLKTKRKFYGGERYEMSRTEEEKISFGIALHETMDLWYAHQGTTVFMLTKLPKGCITRKVGYEDSGWTTYERCSAEQIKKFSLLDAKWKLVVDLGSAEGAEVERKWPIGPDDFDAMIGKKTFTNGADKDAVSKLFRKMSVNQLGSIKALDFDGMKSPSVIDAGQLGRCLNLCKNLQELDLQRVGLSDEACREIFSSLDMGALKSLELLTLGENQVGDAGMEALASAAAGGALPHLCELSLHSNSIGDKGMEAFSMGLAAGAFKELTDLRLTNNYKISDAGVEALASACVCGALLSLKKIMVDRKHEHHPQLVAACQRRGILVWDGADPTF